MDNIRVPRAPNLTSLKSLFLSIDRHIIQKQDIYTKAAKVIGSDAKTYVEEYLRLLSLFNLIVNKKDFVELTDKGKKLMGKFDTKNELTSNDKKIIIDLLSKLPIIQKFLLSVFGYDIKNNYLNENLTLSDNEIYLKYYEYRQTKSKKNTDREARYIFNWLQQVDLLYHDLFIGEFYLTVREMNLPLFNNELKKLYSSIKNKKTNWIEIPVLRYYFCSKFNIHPDLFNKLLVDSIKYNINDISLEKGSLSREEVKREGLNMNKNIYFYIKMEAANG